MADQYLASEIPADKVALIARAIQDADDRFGYNLTLTSLVDGVSTYTLSIDGEKIEVEELEGGHEIIAERRNLHRAEAVLGALSEANRVSGVIVETTYSRFGNDRPKAMEWLMDALISDGVIAYDRRGDLHQINVSESRAALAKANGGSHE